MSLSIKKTKIFGVATAISEKQDKRIWKRKFRKVCKIRTEKEPPINMNCAQISGVVQKKEKDM